MPSFKELVMELLAGQARSASDAPVGIDIDVDQLCAAAEPAAPTPPVPQREGIWKQSSFDLLNGLEVSEEPMETMPDELIEAFFKP